MSSGGTTSPASLSTDLLIIGGGPAGLTSAIVFSRLKRPCIIYDSGIYRNEGVAVSHTIAGFEGVNPASLRAKMRDDLKEWYADTAQYKQGTITSLKKVDGGEQTLFEAKDQDGVVIKARKVVLATGLKDHLPRIPGLAEQWGHRAIHCIFCHGTETANAPFAFLLTSANKMMNPMLVSGMLKLWRPLKHTKTYILTHGTDVSTPEGRKDAGLEKEYELVISLGYEIITSPIESIRENAEKTGLNITFTSHLPIDVPYMLLFPERFTPVAHTDSWLNEELLGAPLDPMGTVPAPPEPKSEAIPLADGRVPVATPKFMPRMGDDPHTGVKGLFWAGNAGSVAANVTLSVAQGQIAGAVAGDELGEEDLQEVRK